jgi:hypothetical protein
MREPGGPLRDEEGAGGHYISSGVALAGLGLLGLVFALTSTLILKTDPQLIDGRAMALTSFGLVSVGAWMIRHGKVPPGEP